MPGQKQEREDIWQYSWKGQRHNVDDGTDMLLQLCRRLNSEQPEKFERLPDEFPFTRKQRFRRDQTVLDRPYRVEGTQVWLDTNMNTAAKKRFAKKLIRHFGHAEEELNFETSLRSLR